MTNEEYTQRVLARASHRWYAEKVDQADFNETVAAFIEWGNRLDRIKKALMYGREFMWDENESTLPIAIAMPNIPEGDQRIIHAALGLATESVELFEAVRDYFLEAKPFDLVNLKEEFGDSAWYLALGLDAIDSSITECLEINDAKLEKRFGKTFSEEAANNRDLDGERQVLEGGSE